MTPEMSCAACRAALVRYSSGNSSADERAALEQHLAACQDCARLAQEWRQVRDVVRASLPRPSSDTQAETSWQMILSRTPATPFVAGDALMFDDAPHAQVESPAHTPKLFRRHPVSRWIVGAVTALIVASLVGLFAGKLPGRNVGTRIFPPQGPPYCAVDTNNPTITQAVSLYDMSMISPTDGWAVGGWQTYGGAASAGVILHLVNGKWTPISQTFPNTLFRSISMTSPTDGWATGTVNNTQANPQQILAHYDGVTWHVQRGPQGQFIGGLMVRMYSATAGWLAPRDVTGNGPVAIWRYSGTAWIPVNTPFISSPPVFDTFYAMAATGPDEVWLAGDHTDDSGTASAGQTVILARYHDGRWDVQAKGINGSMSTIVMASPTDGWATGSNMILHYDGVAWTPVAYPSSFTANNNTWLASAIGPDGTPWFVGVQNGSSGSGSFLVHQRNADVWEKQDIPYDLVVWAISIDQNGDIWGLGAIDHERGCAPAAVMFIDQGVLLHLNWQTGQWSETVEPAK